MTLEAFAAPWVRRGIALSFALALAGCGLQGTVEDTDDGAVPRCGNCVGEDGGSPASPLFSGATIGFLETGSSNTSVPEFTVRGTFPVPPGTVPRVDGRDP